MSAPKQYDSKAQSFDRCTARPCELHGLGRDAERYNEPSRGPTVSARFTEEGSGPTVRLGLTLALQLRDQIVVSEHHPSSFPSLCTLHRCYHLSLYCL